MVDEVDSQGMLQNIMGPFRQQLRSLATRARREGKHRADRSVGRSVGVFESAAYKSSIFFL